MTTELLSPSTQIQPQSGTWIEVRLDRILRNLERLREKALPETRVLAVVKSNAYGHGLVAVSRALEGKVDFLGIGSLQEARVLREAGIQGPLFLFGRLFREEIPFALRLGGVTLTVSSLDEAKAISERASAATRPAAVHVKVDTGMGRLGIPCARAFSEIVTMAGLPGIQLEGIYTHFPQAERFPDFFGETQLANFEKLIRDLEKRGVHFRFRHAANTAGTVRFKAPWLNLVRPGIGLYGIYPDVSLEKEIELEPALAFKTRIAFLKQVAPGDSVGYGREFVAASPATIAVLPVGYAHGYPFPLSGKAEVLYRGKRFRIAGRVCMDSFMIDLGSTTQARVGDEVVLLGSYGEEAVTARELASLAQTIPYEIVTRLDSGVLRLYL